MLAPGHVAVGLLTAEVLTTTFTGHPASPLTLAAATFGSLLPDIDHPGSWVGRRVCPPFTRAITKVFGHRGITHSLLATVAFTTLLFSMAERYDIMLLGPLLVGLCLGYLSHLLADFLTVTGIPFFWPLTTRCRIPIVYFRTGGPVEYLLILASALYLAHGWAGWLFPG